MSEVESSPPAVAKSFDATSSEARARSKILAAAALVLMCLAVLFTFRSPELFTGNWRIDGIDYAMLHRWRIEYAQQAFHQHGVVPSWYSREFMGSPFWSNLQNFPLIPTRLILLWLNAADIFTIEAYLLALATASFAFIYAREIGLSALASAVAGFTFACSGFYVSRMCAGQIGILEVFPSLPVLLWIVRRLCVPKIVSTDSVASRRQSKSFTPPAKWYAALALAIVCFALAAHPQIFIYSAVAAGAYLIWRCRNWTTFLRAAATMALAMGLAGFMLYPMSRLVARSSRMLDLEPARNDLPFRFDRLPALFFPWYNGAPPHVNPPPGTGDVPRAWQTYAIFWDSVDYVGKLPVIAAVLLLAGAVGRIARSRGSDNDSDDSRISTSDAKFIAIMAGVAFVLALPVITTILGGNPNDASGGVMLLRSPARLMYLVTFALALAMGTGIDSLLRFARQHSGAVGTVAIILVGLLIGLQFTDVYRHDRCFVNAAHPIAKVTPDVRDQLLNTVGDGRIGIDKELIIDINRQIDDIGVFDSILLVGTYESILDLNGMPPRTNVQELSGGQMSAYALAACGVKMVITNYPRGAEQPVMQRGETRFFAYAGASPRVLYYQSILAKYFTPEQTRTILRTETENVVHDLVVPPEAKDALDPADPAGDPAAHPVIQPYKRPRDDRFEIHLNEPTSGFVRILEAFDEGWHATIDGKPAPIFRAHNLAMAIPAPPGDHQLVVEFFTPGRNVGIAISLSSVALFAILLYGAQRSEVRKGTWRTRAGTVSAGESITSAPVDPPPVA